MNGGYDRFITFAGQGRARVFPVLRKESREEIFIF